MNSLTPQEKLEQFYNQKPKYKITVKDKKVTYNLNINRKLTIIQGDSGRGKSELLRILDSNLLKGKSRYEKYETTVDCPVSYLVNPRYLEFPKYIKILFLDEYHYLVHEYKLLNELMDNGVYIVIVTRTMLKQLSYSVSEIYTIYESDMNDFSKEVSNNLYRVYNNLLISNINNSSYDLVIIEDSKPSLKFYENFFHTKVISSKGKNNIVPMVNEIVKENKFHKILVIFDSANFGSEIHSLSRLIKQYNIDTLSFESFEFLILQAVSVYRNISNYLNTKLMSDSDKYMFNLEKLFNFILTYASRYADLHVDINSIKYPTKEIEKLILGTMERDSLKMLEYNKNKDINKIFNTRAKKELESFIQPLLEIK